MTKFFKIAIFLSIGLAAPLVLAAICAIWLLFTAPTVFGIILITGATLLVMKNVVLAASAFVISIAAVFLYKNKTKKPETLTSGSVGSTEAPAT